MTKRSPRNEVGILRAIELVESMHEDDIASPIKEAASALLRTTIATEKGRTFNDREDFGRCLYLLAVLSNAPEWDFLRGG